MEEKILKIGILSSGGNLKIENGLLIFSHPYGKTFQVLITDIETVVVDVRGMGVAILKIMGHGTTLASTEMPIPWAKLCQEWILKNK